MLDWGLTTSVRRLGAALSIVRDFTNWREVVDSIRTNTPCTTLQRRNGTAIVGMPDTQLWNHYNDIWNHRSYTRLVDIPRQGIVVDIGANVGLFSLFAARTARAVYALEPSSRNFMYLTANTRAVPQISTHRIALGGFDGTALLRTSGSPTTYTLAGDTADGSAVETVNVWSLNTLFTELQIGHCDYMKIDCEGAEYEILLSAEPAILEKVGRIVLEFHDHLSQSSHKDPLLSKTGSWSLK
jgi:FkbM family methyltransferase